MTKILIAIAFTAMLLVCLTACDSGNISREKIDNGSSTQSEPPDTLESNSKNTEAAKNDGSITNQKQALPWLNVQKSPEELLFGMWEIIDCQGVDGWEVLGVRMFFPDYLFAAADDTWYVSGDKLFLYDGGIEYSYSFSEDRQTLAICHMDMMPIAQVEGSQATYDEILSEYKYEKTRSFIDNMQSSSPLVGRWDTVGYYPVELNSTIVFLPDGTAAIGSDTTWHVRGKKIFIGDEADGSDFNVSDNKLEISGDEFSGAFQRVEP